LGRRDSSPIVYALRSHLASAILSQRTCPAEAAQAALHTHPYFSFATIAAARVNKAAEPHSRVTKRVRTYNHLLGDRHWAFASKTGEIFAEKANRAV
jgi:predicted secreted Zn-dependent protease